MKILFGVCTQSSKEDVVNTKFFKSIFDEYDLTDSENDYLFVSSNNFDAIIKCVNKKSICSHFNSVIEFGIQNEYDCVIFCHDDVSIEDKFLIDKLEDGFDTNDIIGLAGAKDCTIAEPILWHLMSKKESWSGAVAHPVDDKTFAVTSFGPTPSRCLVMDGLFLAVRVDALVDTDLRFDENIPCISHFYDIDFCLNANSKQLKLTTWPIWVTHSSPGLRNVTGEFNAGQQYIINKWKRSKQS